MDFLSLGINFVTRVTRILWERTLTRDFSAPRAHLIVF